MDRSEVEEFPSLFFHRPTHFSYLLLSLDYEIASD